MKKWIAGILGIISICFLSAGISTKAIGGKSISVIGGSDGPTSIFLAGKVGNDYSLLLIGAGLLTAGIAVLLLLIKKKNNKGE